MAAKAMALIKASREGRKAKDMEKRAKGGKTKRKSFVAAESDDDEDVEVENLDLDDEPRASKRRRGTKQITLDSDEDDDIVEEDDHQTNHATSSQPANPQSSQRPQRPRARGPFQDDSDDDAPVMLSDSDPETDTPPSSVPEAAKARERRAVDAVGNADADVDMQRRPETQESEKENRDVAVEDVHDGMEVDGREVVVPGKVSVTRRGVRAGFVLDDSDEE